MIVREPIVGWRRWNFMYPHFLANLGNDTIYVPREKIEAHCEQYSTIGTLPLRKDHSEQQAPHLIHEADVSRIGLDNFLRAHPAKQHDQAGPTI